jgi:hypothetical protein
VLVEGAKADLVVFDDIAPKMLGWADPVAAVMLHPNVGNIQHVLVDGKFRKRDLRLTAKGNYANITPQFLPLPDASCPFWRKHPIRTSQGRGRTRQASIIRESACHLQNPPSAQVESM